MPDGETQFEVEASKTCLTSEADEGRQKGCYLWCPVQSSKRDRFSLKKCLPTALQFLSMHLQKGRKVLVHDDQG